MSAKRQIFVVGNGMTKFEKPGSRDEFDYPDMAKEAVNNALKDAKINYGEIQQACVGYCYGDTTCGQRALYEVGMTGIPIFNVNNACSTGSTALFMARQLVEGGLADCVLALGFEKMEKGSLTPKFMDRTNPMEKHVEVMASVFELESAPFMAQMFGNAGKEHMKKYGTKPEHFAKIAWKNHLHSVNNPYSQFQDQYSMDQILNSPMVHEPLTKLQCCPTSDGAAAAIVCSAAFVEKHGLQDQAIEIVAQEMATDLPSTFNEGSCMKVVGYDMTKTAADRLYRGAGVKPTDIDVVELHDCFSTNELISYEALGLCEPGEAGSMVDRGDNTYGGKYVINPSGGLISKGHPLGATGLAQCAELCWQLKGQAGKRQVKGAKLALQHNIGLGGAVVVTLYRLGFPEAASGSLRVVTSPAADMSPEGFRAAPIFNLIQEALMKDGANIVKKVNAVYLFKITEGPNGSEGLWTVDVKNGSGSVKIGGDGAKPNVTLTISDSDFVELAEGRLKPQVAFFQKKLKLAGNMVLAMKLNSVLPPAGTAVSVTQTPANEGFKSSSIFKEVEERLRRDGDKIVGKVKGIYLFKVTGGPAGKDAMWLVDVKNGKGAVKSGPGKADCTITISDEDLLKVASGKLSAQTAFFSKKLKIAGNIGLAMKLKEVLPTPGQAKL